MLEERSTTSSMATPSVDFSERTVPFLGRPRANIKSAIQINLAAVIKGLNFSLGDTGHFFIFSRDENFTEAVRFLRLVNQARTGNTKNNIKIHGE